MFTLLLQGAAYCTVTKSTGQPATVAAIAGISKTASHTCLIEVTFPVFDNSALVATTTVNAVLMDTLVLRAGDYDYTSASQIGTLATVAASTATPATLQQISCNSSDFEQVGLELTFHSCLL